LSMRPLPDATGPGSFAKTDPDMARSRSRQCALKPRMHCPCRLADAYLSPRQVTEGAGSRRQQTSIAQRHPWADECVGRDPHIPADRDRPALDVHVGALVGMGAGNDVRILADAGALADGHAAHAIDDDMVADRGLRPEREVPWELDAGTRL